MYRKNQLYALPKKERVYDAALDCPTLAPGQRASAVSMMQLGHVDAVTLAMMLCVPPENIAVVVVRTDVMPNSAASWNCPRNETPDCDQLFFFDTRRSVQELRQTVNEVMQLNHRRTPAGMPLFKRTVPRDVAKRHCQCSGANCPGEQYRCETLKRKSGRVNEPLFGPTPTDLCPIALSNYTRAEPHADPSTLFALHNWVLYDAESKFPVLPEADGVGDSLKTHGWHAVRLAASVASQIDGRTQLSASRVDVKEVMELHAGSAHTVPLCFRDAIPFMQQTINAQLTLEKILEEADKIPTEKFGVSGKQMPVSDDAPALIMAHTVLDQLAQSAKIKDADSHPYGCSCFFEHFLKTRCRKQLSLILVPLPTNVVYRVVGDSIFNISSPLMRRLGLLGALEKANRETVLGLGGELRDIEFDKDADRSSPHHPDSILAERKDLRQTLYPVFGAFHHNRGARLPNDLFESTETQRQYSFQDSVRRMPLGTKRKIGVCEFTDVPDVLTPYAELLRYAKESANAPAKCESLLELALHRNMFDDIELWESRLNLLPVSLYYMARHACRNPKEIKKYATEILNAPENQNRIFTTTCERLIVEELLCTPNWRLAIARASAISMHELSTLGDYRLSIVYTICMLLITKIIAELQPYIAECRAKEQLAARLLAMQQQKTAAVAPPRSKKRRTPPTSPKKARQPQQQRQQPPAEKKLQLESGAVEQQDDSGNWLTVGAKGKALKPPPSPPSPSLLDFFLEAIGQTQLFSLMSDTWEGRAPSPHKITPIGTWTKLSSLPQIKIK